MYETKTEIRPKQALPGQKDQLLLYAKFVFIDLLLMRNARKKPRATQKRDVLSTMGVLVVTETDAEINNVRGDRIDKRIGHLYQRNGLVHLKH